MPPGDSSPSGQEQVADNTGSAAASNSAINVKIPYIKTEFEWKTERLDSSYLPLKTQLYDMGDMDDSPAVLFVVDSNGLPTIATNHFMLTSVQESRQEKSQIIETFGLPSFFFFGERTKVYHFSGTLIETSTTMTKQASGKNLWGTNIIDLYDRKLRGSKLAENNEEVVLTFKNYRLFGYIINLNLKHDANSPKTAGFSFSMIVRKHDFIKPDLIDKYDIFLSGATDEERASVASDLDDLKDTSEALEETKPDVWLEIVKGFQNSSDLKEEYEKISSGIITAEDFWNWLEKRISSHTDSEEVITHGWPFVLEFYSSTTNSNWDNATRIAEIINGSLSGASLPEIMKEQATLRAQILYSLHSIRKK